MIGFYDYTVWLTYASLVSAVTGIFTCFAGDGHPYISTMLLLFCGLCDAFDGIVARTKKDRTETQKRYGIQLDSLSDIVAFGVLPACIGASIYKITPSVQRVVPYTVCIVIFALYVLAALIRLAYFNVTEEERSKTETTVRKEYTGLPVTSAALVFPTFVLVNYIAGVDITYIYYILMLFISAAFLGKFSVRKPKLKHILMMVALGAVEFALMTLIMIYRTK